MSTIKINGKVYSGNNITIQNGKVIIDGKTTESNEKIINIIVEGNIETLKVDFCETIKANDVKTLITTSGDVTCNNVNSVETTSGDIECNDVNGNVTSTSGDINCKSIKGNCRTVSGDIG